MTFKTALIGLYALLPILVAAHLNAESQVQRYASVTTVKPDKVAYYKKLHAHPWPCVLKQLAAMNIHNYSIYLIQAEKNRFYLFSYFEYTGSDFKTDMKKFGQDPQCLAWLKETGSCQQVIALGKEGQVWTAMEEVFHNP